MKFVKPLVTLLSTLVALSGCSKADLLNITIPSSGYTIHKDIAYGTHQQKLDVYSPDKPDANKTVVVFFFGGAWQTGSKDIYKFVGQALTSKGYTVVVPDYRKYPEVYFPAFMDDSAESVAWVQSHIGEYDGNPKFMYLSGHSAGAHMAALLALDEHYFKNVHGSAAWVKGVIGLAGPYDFTPDEPKIIAVFSKATKEQFLPVSFAHSHAPPMLLISGAEDDQVGAKNARNLGAKLREANDTVVELTYPDVGHIGLVLSLAYGFRSKAPALVDIDSFIRQGNQR